MRTKPHRLRVSDAGVVTGPCWINLFELPRSGANQRLYYPERGSYFPAKFIRVKRETSSNLFLENAAVIVTHSRKSGEKEHPISMTSSHVSGSPAASKAAPYEASNEAAWIVHNAKAPETPRLAWGEETPKQIKHPHLQFSSRSRLKVARPMGDGAFPAFNRSTGCKTQGVRVLV